MVLGKGSARCRASLSMLVCLLAAKHVASIPGLPFPLAPLPLVPTQISVLLLRGSPTTPFWGFSGML